ncbi:MAG: Uma2 family endonuclease [Acidimicrobiales bacterium]
MRVVMVDAPDHFLEERRRLGHDRWDEMWEGVLHVAPLPDSRNQRLAIKLGAILLPLAEAPGLIGLQSPSGFWPGRTDSWRVPALGFARREFVSERGVEGRAKLVVEVRSPRDETYDKLPFYGEVGCQEVLVVDRDSLALELFVSQDGQMVATAPDAGGRLRLASVDASVGPAILIEWAGGSAAIVPY